MITTDLIDRLIGADAVDQQDDRIGEISQVYVDEESASPTWVSVRLGLLSSAEVLVPLEDAKWDDRALHVAVERQTAREAPRKEMDEPLTVQEESRLYTHYGIPCIRHPRSELGVPQAEVEDVCYSIHDDAIEPVELKQAS
jgi:hypothetical protein